MLPIAELKSPALILNQSPNTWPTPREKSHLSPLVQDIQLLASGLSEVLTNQLITPSLVAINATATASASQMLSGVITSTSLGATAITTPTAASIYAIIPQATTGSSFQLIIDNSAGANTVTLTLDASITAPVGAITGGNTLTVTTTHKVGRFWFYFTSPTTANVFRIA